MTGDEARARRYLLAGSLVLLAVRGLLALPRLGPLHVSDEIGYLTNARVLGGGTPAELLTTAVYRGGYSLLLTPLTLMSDDPAVVYRLALLVNVLLAATLPALLYLLLTRCFEVAPRTAVLPALAAACYPSLTQATGAAMSENLLVPLTVAWLLCFGLLLGTRRGAARVGWAVALGLCAALLWTTHGRMVVAVAVTAVAVPALAITRSLPVRLAAWCLATLAGGLWAGHQLNEHLIAENYGGRHVDEAGTRLSALDNVDGVLSVSRNLAGHAWYVVVATLGIALVLFVAETPRLARVLRRRALTTADVVLAALFATTAGLLALSALSFPEPARPDQLVYGRYVEAVTPAVLAVGLTRLPAGWSTRGLLAALGTVLALTALVAGLRRGISLAEMPNEVNVASLPPGAGALGPSAIAWAGVIVTACAAMLLVVARRRAWAVAPLLVLLLLPATVQSERALLRSSNENYPSGWAGPAGALEGRRARTIGYDVDRSRDEFYGGLKYSWFLTRSVVVHFSSRIAPPPSRYVIGADAWSAGHPDQAARPLWRDPARDQTLWRLEAEPLAPLAQLARCLRAAGRPSRRTGQRLSVTLGDGSVALVTLFGTERAAMEHERNTERFLRAAGRASTLVRGGRIAVGFPAPPDAAERALLRRCL